MLYIIKRI